MYRSVVVTLTTAILLVGVVPAGEVEPQGTDFLVSTFAFGPKGAAVAMDREGAFVVAWDEHFCCMTARGYDGDGNQAATWFLPPGFPTTPDPIDVAAFAENDFVVVWESEINSLGYTPVLHAQRFAIDGTPLGALVEIASAAGGSDNRHPTVERWNSLALVGWAQADPSDPAGDGFDIQAAAVSVDAGAVPEGHLMVNTYTTGDQDSPNLAVGEDASFILVWRSVGSPGTDRDGESVQARWYSPDDGFEAQFQVNTVTSGDQANADVAMASDGRFLIVWDGLGNGEDTDGSVQGRIYDPERQPLGPEFQINTQTADSQSQPTVASRADGSFLVVWGSPLGIFGQVVGPEGELVGSEIQINSTPGTVYARPTVSGDLDGRFVVAWDSEDDYGYYGDNRRARLLSDVVFADGFESGDTSAWSLTVP